MSRISGRRGDGRLLCKGGYPIEDRVGETCGEPTCQACCEHNTLGNHDLCNECGKDMTEVLVAQAEARLEGDR